MNSLLKITSLIDTHCHIDFVDFDHDREQVLNNASKLGIEKIIVPAVSQSTWQRTIDICSQYLQLGLALGLHPVFIDDHKEQHIAELKQLVKQHKPIAVGEIGLDFYQKELNKDQQHYFFEQQLIIAKEAQLPVIIHNRKAHDECLLLLNKHKVKGGIIHAFNGSVQQAHKYIELGFLLGFGGMLTFERSSKLHSLLKILPLSSIVLETDAPDMTVSQYKGARNSPEYLPLIANSVANLLNESVETITQQTSNNFTRVFNPLI